MAASFVRVAPDSSGKYVQTFSNTISATLVEANAIVPVDSAGVERTAWPVTGTFWQATQPVSGTVTANAGTGTFAVSGTFWQATQPVSGTFWQATQPISGTVTVTPPTLTKGTQGSTGFSVQRIQDAGRTAISLWATGVTAGTTATEALVTFTRSTVAGAATTSANTFVITSGKTFRITAIVVAARNMAATVATTLFTLRINTAGAVATTSPAAISLRCATAATINFIDRVDFEPPDGIEIAGNGTIQFGLSVNPVWTTTASQYDVNITGYEY
ncbi:MAG: hypothetical protein M3R04_09335 [bacterium]|nr:hypothetical protein [bacterium]